MTSSMKTCFLKRTHLVGNAKHRHLYAVILSNFMCSDSATIPNPTQLNPKHSCLFLLDGVLSNYLEIIF